MQIYFCKLLHFYSLNPDYFFVKIFFTKLCGSQSINLSNFRWLTKTNYYYLHRCTCIPSTRHCRASWNLCKYRIGF